MISQTAVIIEALPVFFYLSSKNIVASRQVGHLNLFQILPRRLPFILSNIVKTINIVLRLRSYVAVNIMFFSCISVTNGQDVCISSASNTSGPVPCLLNLNGQTKWTARQTQSVLQWNIFSIYCSTKGYTWFRIVLAKGDYSKPSKTRRGIC
jgi:hypothetical protein